MGLFRRSPVAEPPRDMNARHPELGVRYKDLLLLGQMLQQGANLHEPRHVLYYLYFGSKDVASTAADEARAGGYSCEVREPLPAYPGQWSLVCERHEVVLDLEQVRAADDLFQSMADRLSGDFDGWEASV
jgi:hypothetical protein